MGDVDKWIIVVEMPDGTKNQYLSLAYRPVGTFYNKGKIIECRQLSRKFVSAEQI